MTSTSDHLENLSLTDDLDQTSSGPAIATDQGEIAEQPLALGQDDEIDIRHRRLNDGVRHTRIGALWATIVAAVVLGVALIDFVVENTRAVRVDFFGASGHIPVAVSLLVAALTGAVIVLSVGICRTTQLRLALRRRTRHGAKNAIH